MAAISDVRGTIVIEVRPLSYDLVVPQLLDLLSGIAHVDEDLVGMLAEGWSERPGIQRTFGELNEVPGHFDLPEMRMIMIQNIAVVLGLDIVKDLRNSLNRCVHQVVL